MIRTTSKKLEKKKFPSAKKNRFKIFDFSSHLERIKCGIFLKDRRRIEIN